MSVGLHQTDFRYWVITSVQQHAGDPTILQEFTPKGGIKPGEFPPRHDGTLDRLDFFRAAQPKVYILPPAHKKL